MKKFSLLFCISFGFLLSKAQVATDFTATDCNGNSHTLFDELNAGKVIVITWVMPCGECVAGALTAYNITQSFEADFPGRVKMYISDDYANTPCSSLNAWCTTYGLARAIKFSDSAIRMSDYGFSGMPKTVAIAPDRTVIFNENYTVDADSLQSVIETALTTTSVKSLPAFISTPSVYPNPAIQQATLKLDFKKSFALSVTIFDMEGNALQLVYKGQGNSGQNLIPLDVTQLSNGLYQIQITAGDSHASIPLLVSR